MAAGRGPPPLPAVQLRVRLGMCSLPPALVFKIKTVPWKKRQFFLSSSGDFSAPGRCSLRGKCKSPGGTCPVGLSRPCGGLGPRGWGGAAPCEGRAACPPALGLAPHSAGRPPTAPSETKVRPIWAGAWTRGCPVSCPPEPQGRAGALGVSHPEPGRGAGPLGRSLPDNIHMTLTRESQNLGNKGEGPRKPGAVLPVPTFGCQVKTAAEHLVGATIQAVGTSGCEGRIPRAPPRCRCPGPCFLAGEKRTPGP